MDFLVSWLGLNIPAESPAKTVAELKSDVEKRADKKSAGRCSGGEIYNVDKHFLPC